MNVGVVAAALGVAVFGLPLPVAAADQPVCSGTSCSFTSPNRSIGCTITAGAGKTNPDGVFCGWTDGERSHTVTMAANGMLDPCINPAVDLVNRCTVTPMTGVIALGYGQTATLGPFNCLAEAQAITCTVAPAGKGFTMNKAGILPVLPPPPPPPPEPAATSVAPAPTESPAPGTRWAPAPTEVPPPAPPTEMPAELAPPPPPMVALPPADQ